MPSSLVPARLYDGHAPRNRADSGGSRFACLAIRENNLLHAALAARDSDPPMCRFLAYSGAPVFLEDLVAAPCHSLIHQSLHAAEAKTGTNGDGFGVG